jgi:hypothetical protein
VGIAGGADRSAILWPIVFLKVVAAIALGIGAARETEPIWIALRAAAASAFALSALANGYLWRKSTIRRV